MMVCLPFACEYTLLLALMITGYRRCSRSYNQGVLQLLGAFYSYYAVDVRPVYELYPSTEENPGRP